MWQTSTRHPRALSTSTSFPRPRATCLVARESAGKARGRVRGPVFALAHTQMSTIRSYTRRLCVSRGNMEDHMSCRGWRGSRTRRGWHAHPSGEGRPLVRPFAHAVRFQLVRTHCTTFRGGCVALEEGRRSRTDEVILSLICPGSLNTRFP